MHQELLAVENLVHRLGGGCVENLRLKPKELTMPLNPQHALQLTDAYGRSLGLVSIERIEGNQVLGSFTSEDDFAAVRDLFEEFEAAVNEQVFGEADRLSHDIDRLGLALRSLDAVEQLAVCDVQIMDGSAFSCRVPNLALTQLPRAVA